MQVEIRSREKDEGTYIQRLQMSTLREIFIEFPDFGKKCELFENQILRKGVNNPLDYILPVRTI